MEEMKGLLLAIRRLTTSFLTVSRFFSRKFDTSYQTSPVVGVVMVMVMVMMVMVDEVVVKELS